jgi:hypothetical protein
MWVLEGNVMLYQEVDGMNLRFYTLLDLMVSAVAVGENVIPDLVEVVAD